MLDLAGILFSTVMVLLVVVRAVRLDRSQPWFQGISNRNDVAYSASGWRTQRD